MRQPRTSVCPAPVSELEARLIARIRALALKSGSQQHKPWREIARPKQLPPAGDWLVWLVMTGRGWGKNRMGSEWVREEVEAGRARRIALVGQDAADVRDVMVEGESGILACAAPGFRPHYEPSKRRLTWPNGAIATTYGGDDYDALRGPQHDLAYVDELAKFRYPRETWDNLMLGLRLGPHPRVLVTTTPRPVKVLKEIMSKLTTVVISGHTIENIDNLAPSFRVQIMAQYEGTRLGRQELAGEILEDVEGALWTWALIEAARVSTVPEGMLRSVLAIDPAVTSHEGSDETGLIVAGVAMCDCKGEPEKHAFVLADLSCRLSPDGWARRAVNAYLDMRCDRIVAEVNNGGELVLQVLRTVDRHVSYKAVSASRGKRVRAEPIAALYEQGKVHHVGRFDALEDQMTGWVPDAHDGSPDRLDALVWALTDLMLEDRGRPGVRFV